MAHSHRPHNIGEVFFNALSAAASSGQKAILSGIEQRRADTQQTFINDLATKSGEREDTRLTQAQTRIDLQQGGLDLRQDDFERQKQVDLFNAMQKPTLSEVEKAQIASSEALTAKRIKETELLGQGGGQVTANTFNTIFDELGLGFKQRELARQLEAQNPAFGKMIPAESNFFSADTPARFEPRGDIGLDEISIPPDTLTALLQQVRQIAGGGSAPQSTPATDLSNLGKEPVFPDSSRGLDLAEAEGLARQWAESGGISDWDGLSEDVRRQIIDKLLSEGIPSANR